MLSIGILGAGNFACKHLYAIAALPERARTVKVARSRAALWEEAAAREIEQVSPEALIASPEVDAVAVCVPNHLHAAYVSAALEAGKHVFCEKPLATTLADADRLIALARERNRVLMVGHLTRHTPGYVAVADVLKSGRLGGVVAVHASRRQVRGSESWRTTPESGGAAFDLLIHDFDLLGWYLGRPEGVAARCVASNYLVALFDYGNGLAPVVEGGFVLPEGAPFQSMLRIVCEGGLLEIDPNLPPGTILRIVEGDSQTTMIPAPRYTKTCRGLLGEYEEFLDTIEGRPHDRLLLKDARLAAELASRAAEAAKTGAFMPFEREENAPAA